MFVNCRINCDLKGICRKENIKCLKIENKYIWANRKKVVPRAVSKSIFQCTSTAQNELNIVSLYLWLYEKPRRPPKIPFQFLSKLNSTKKKKMTVFDSPK